MTIPCRAKRTLIAGLALAAGCLTTAPALAAAPANDDFANAASLGTAKALATQYTLDEATGQVFEQHPQGGLGNSVWYSWTAPTDGHVQVLACTANGTIHDHATVYEGTQISALVWQSSVGPALCGAGSTFQAWQGHTYRVQVEGDYGFPHAGVGPLQLDLRTTPSATISLPATITSNADGSGNAKPTGLTFYGFDWSVQPAQGDCSIDGSTQHVKYCYAGSLAWTGLSAGDHALKFRAVDPWGFWSNTVTSTITVPAPAPQSPGAPPLQVAPKPPATAPDPPATPATPADPVGPAGPAGPVVPAPSASACSGRPVLTSSAKLSLRTLRGRGARVKFAASSTCPLTFTVTVAGHKGTLASRKGVKSGTAVTLKPSRAALKRLHVHRGARLKVTATNAAAAHTSITVRVTA